MRCMYVANMDNPAEHTLTKNIHEAPSHEGLPNPKNISSFSYPPSPPHTASFYSSHISKFFSNITCNNTILARKFNVKPRS